MKTNARLAAGVFCAALASCHEEKAITSDSAAPVLQAPALAARTEDQVGEAASKDAKDTKDTKDAKETVAAIEGVEATEASTEMTRDEKAAEGKIGSACRGAPAWIELRRCAHDGRVYASGAIKGVRDLSVARTAAAERARRAIAGALINKSKLQGSEVTDVYQCQGQLFALARAPKEAVSGALPECDAGAVEVHPAEKDGCPAWTQRISWRDESTIFAVGAAKMKNRALAEAAAANRARAELTRVVKVEAFDHGAAATGAGSFSEVQQKHAQCDGYTYVLVAAKELAASNH